MKQVIHVPNIILGVAAADGNYDCNAHLNQMCEGLTTKAPAVVLRLGFNNAMLIENKVDV